MKKVVGRELRQRSKDSCCSESGVGRMEERAGCMKKEGGLQTRGRS